MSLNVIFINKYGVLKYPHIIGILGIKHMRYAGLTLNSGFASEEEYRLVYHGACKCGAEITADINIFIQVHKCLCGRGVGQNQYVVACKESFSVIAVFVSGKRPCGMSLIKNIILISISIYYELEQFQEGNSYERRCCCVKHIFRN